MTHSNRLLRILLLVVVTTLAFAIFASAAGPVSAQLTVSGTYRQTSRLASDTGQVKLSGSVTTTTTATFKILAYTTQTSTLSVWADNVTGVDSFTTPNRNFQYLAYAGYVQRYNQNVGVAATVSISTS